MKRRIPFAVPVIVVFLALVLPRGPGAIAQSATPALAPAADSTSVAEPAPAPTPTSAASAVAASDSTSAIKVAERDAERAERLAIRDNGLAMLYKTQPEVQKAVEAAAGYAVLDVTAVYIILFVGQSGKGVLVDNASKKVTYMSSKRVGTGPGAGKQRVFQIFVFKEKSAMDTFVLSGGVGGDIGVAATMGSHTMLRSFNKNIDIYQIAESGFALQAGWGGTVYSVDKDLQ